MSSDSGVKPGASASENESVDVLTLLAQGKRHILVEDYSEAVSSLGQACGLLAVKYGETADECGEAYLYYGKALLELARTESGVLGDVIEGDGSAEDSDEEADEPEENGKDKEEDEKKDEANTSADAAENATEEKGEETSTAEGTEQADEESEEDVSNLKLSWEMLELAKIIFQRQTKDRQVNLKLAEVYLNLGEVSLESETYEQAIQDLRSGLSIQKELLEEDNRRIAETYYRLGLAYSLNNEFDEAFQHYSNALETLELRVKNLELKRESGDKPDESDAFYTIEGEIKELNEIIPEIKEKVIELQEVKAEAIKAVSELIKKEGAAGSSKQTTEPSPKPVETKPASNITHLVRKKQKVEEPSSVQKSPSSEAVPSKIQKAE